MSDKPDKQVWEGTDVLREEVRTLQVPLTEDQRAQRGRQLALQVAEVADLEARHKSEAKQFREEQRHEMALAVADREGLAKAVNTGEEPGPVKCIHLADYKRGVKYVVRSDSGVIVGTRRLTEDELQVDMPIPLRVVADPETGKLVRADGQDVETLPLVKPNQCAPRACRECGITMGDPHEAGCELREGRGKVLARHCAVARCSTCNMELGERHEPFCTFA